MPRSGGSARSSKLPDSLRQLVNWVLRAGDVGVHELAMHLDQDDALAASLLGDLSRKGLVAEQPVAGEARYRVWTQDRRRRGVSSNLWRALE